MTATLVLSQNVYLTTELCVGVNCAGLCKNLTSLDLSSLNTTEENTYVVACLSIVKSLSEHLKTCNNNFSLLVCKTNDLNFLRSSDLASLNSTCSNSTTACDCEYVLNRHKEGLVSLTVRCRNELVNSVHKLVDASILRSVGILRSALESNISRTLDDGCVVAGELVLVESCS